MDCNREEGEEEDKKEGEVFGEGDLTGFVGCFEVIVLKQSYEY